MLFYNALLNNRVFIITNDSTILKKITPTTSINSENKHFNEFIFFLLLIFF